MAWFVRPHVQFRRDMYRAIRRRRKCARGVPRERGQLLEAAAGRVFGNWGEVAVGAFRTRTRLIRKSAPQPLTGTAGDDGGVSAEFHVDTLDTVTWPRDGIRVDAVYRRSIESFGADDDGEHRPRIKRAW